MKNNKNKVPKKVFSKMKKIKVVQNCLKWREIGQKRFLDFLAPPPPKKNRVTLKLFVKNGKNKSCTKFPEIARKLIEI